MLNRIWSKFHISRDLYVFYKSIAILKKIVAAEPDPKKYVFMYNIRIRTIERLLMVSCLAAVAVVHIGNSAE
jgi:hypothetical protein